MQLPDPTPKYSLSLTPPQLTDHRAKIGFEVEVILDGYWQTRPSEAVKTGILADWMDNLQDWHPDQIRAALRYWRNRDPNKKPNAGHIMQVLKRERGQAYVDEKCGRKVNPLFAIDRPLMLEVAQ